jgi:sulfonate transport system substrate-binding protein
MNRFRAALVALAVTALWLGLVGGSVAGGSVKGQGSPNAGAAEPVVTVRIATPRTAGTAIIYLAESYAKKRGLRFEYSSAFTFADMQRNLATEAVDASFLGYTNPAMMADQKITNVKIVAGSFTRSQNVVARTGSGIDTWADLEGKRVGIVPGSYAHIMFVVAAEEHDVDLDKVKLQNVPVIPAAVVNALKNGQVDALVMWPPVLQQAIQQGAAYAPRGIDIFDNTTLGGGTDGMLAVTTSFRENTAVFTKFLRSYVDAMRYAQRNRAKYAAFAARVTGVDLATSRASLGPGKLQGGFSFKVSRQGLLGAAKLGPSFGYARRDQSARVLSYLDLEPLARLLRVPVASLFTPRL